MSSSLVAAGSTAESPTRQQDVPWHKQRCVNTPTQRQPQTHRGPQQHTLTQLQGTAIRLRSHTAANNPNTARRAHGNTALPVARDPSWCCKRFTAQPLCGSRHWRWRQQPQFCRLRRSSSRQRLQCASRLWLSSQSHALTTPKETSPPPRPAKQLPETAALEVLEARAWVVRAAARGCGRPLLVD